MRVEQKQWVLVKEGEERECGGIPQKDSSGSLATVTNL